MTKYVHGDIFDSTCQTLVNPVNCVGVMGRGLALEFKKRSPEMFEDYREDCRHNIITLGVPILYNLSTPWIINFPTKYYWRDRSKIEDIEEGMYNLFFLYKPWKITSLAIPKLGCGLGGLEWDEVRKVISKYTDKMDVVVEIYE